jgi:hypothetical protein
VTPLLHGCHQGKDGERRGKTGKDGERRKLLFRPGGEKPPLKLCLKVEHGFGRFFRGA